MREIHANAEVVIIAAVAVSLNVISLVVMAQMWQRRHDMMVSTHSSVLGSSCCLSVHVAYKLHTVSVILRSFEVIHQSPALKAPADLQLHTAFVLLFIAPMQVRARCVHIDFHNCCC
jgi:hypothetical protein